MKDPTLHVLVDDHLRWLSRFLILALANGQLNNLRRWVMSFFQFQIFLQSFFIIISLWNQTTGICCLYTDFL